MYTDAIEIEQISHVEKSNGTSQTMYLLRFEFDEAELEFTVVNYGEADTAAITLYDAHSAEYLGETLVTCACRDQREGYRQFDTSVYMQIIRMARKYTGRRDQYAPRLVWERIRANLGTCLPVVTAEDCQRNLPNPRV